MDAELESFDLDLALALDNRDGSVPSFVDRPLPDFPLTISDRDFLLDGLAALAEETSHPEDSAAIRDLRRRLMTYNG